MLDKTILDEMKEIKGYMASAITDQKGDILVSDATKLQSALDDVSHTINNIFVASKAVSNRMEFGEISLLEFHAQNASAVMASSGENEESTFHIFAILEPEGNISLAKVAIEQTLKKCCQRV